MTADIVVTLPAGVDIDVILCYLQCHAGQSVADDYRQNLGSAFLRLSAFSESATLRPALGLGMRPITVRPYVIVIVFQFEIRELEGEASQGGVRGSGKCSGQRASSSMRRS